MIAKRPPNTERVMIFIDGGNFYRLIRTPEAGFPKGTKFSYKKFIDFLVSSKSLVEKKYYVGIVKNIDGTAKSTEMVKSQQKFLSELEKDGFIIERGKIVYDNKIREKGVDVKIAIDLVIGAAEDKYDTAIIVSSDTDLVPAIKYVQTKGKKVEYIGFSFKPSVALVKESDIPRLLAPDDLSKFKEDTLFTL